MLKSASLHLMCAVFVTALTSGTLAGMIIADEILGRDNPFAKVGDLLLLYPPLVPIVACLVPQVVP